MARKVKRQSLGQRIKWLRENRDMSLEALANESGYAADYLANLENDDAMPPVSVLLTLSRALMVDSGVLLKDEDDEEEAMERRAQAVAKRTDHYSYQVLTPEAGKKHLKAFLITIDPVSDLEGPGYQHEGEEFHYVLSGEVEIKVGDNVNRLGAGETLHFNSNLVHKLRNVGQDACRLLVVLYIP